MFWIDTHSNGAVRVYTVRNANKRNETVYTSVDRKDCDKVAERLNAEAGHFHAVA